MESATLLTVRIPAFEAAVRKSADASLAARPVAIATSFKAQGRIIAACPLARQAGIAEEMQYPEARSRCPDAAFFLSDRQLAAKAVEKLIETAAVYSPQVESAGGGRILLDTKGTERLWGGSIRVAEQLQARIREQLRLPASAGLAEHRPWSLLASRAAGDSGICHVPPGREHAFLDQIPADWVDGVTPRTRARLLELSIVSLGQLRQFSRSELRRQFGNNCGEALSRAIHPQPWDMVALAGETALPDPSEQEIRVEAVLGEATVELEKIRITVASLARETADTLRRRGLGAAWLGLTLLYADGAFKTARQRCGGYIQKESILADLAQILFDKVFRRRVRASRLWLTAEKLASPMRQGDLFANMPSLRQLQSFPAPSRCNEEKLLAALDSIRSRYGEESLQQAAYIASTGKKAPA